MFKFQTSPNQTKKQLLDALSKDVKEKTQSKDVYERRTVNIPLGGIAVPLVKIGER
ncbi:hypothetical protein [Burkholderia sp. S-53]|uniref:hypothetical protein n=1 Tax=Burkholderia sp. S-53 TaxID=2906514 RepID=UPI0021D1B8F4|nr:hypothetical protein [Burkholderia sp. S-53]UXU90020.1 hypothetical protein LXM88_32375 [Burkholderia sp. S-53]